MRRLGALLGIIGTALALLSGCGPDLPGNGSEHGAPGVVEPHDRVYLVTVTATVNRVPQALPVQLTVYADLHEHAGDSIPQLTADRLVTTPYTYTVAVDDGFTDPIYLTADIMLMNARAGSAVQVVITRQGHPGRVAAAGAAQSAQHLADTLNRYPNQNPTIHTFCEAVI